MANNWRMPVTVTTKGIPQTLLVLKRLRKGMHVAGVRGMKKAVNYLLRETKKVTPKKTGLLRSTGRAEVYTDDEDLIYGVISFYVYYAIFVHEDLYAFHAPGTYAKFLERTVRNRQHLTIAREMMATEIIKEERKAM
jgi:hypothetical protein